MLLLCLGDHTLEETLKIFLLLKRHMIFFKNSFFPSTIIEWKKIDKNTYWKKHFEVCTVI